MRFLLGQLLATPGALEAITEAGQTPEVFLHRHRNGDWGDLDDHDQAANERALLDGSRIFSAYHTNQGIKIWVITEADRSATTILLPDEY